MFFAPGCARRQLLKGADLEDFEDKVESGASLVAQDEGQDTKVIKVQRLALTTSETALRLAMSELAAALPWSDSRTVVAAIMDLGIG